MAFGPFGFIGWQCGIPEAEQAAFFWSSFPISAFVNTDITLQVFFALIAFIPAMSFFQNNDTEWIKKQAIIRYFRLLPYIIVAYLCSYIVYHQGWYYNKELSEVLNINWNVALLYGDFSLATVLTSALFRDFVIAGGS